MGKNLKEAFKDTMVLMALVPLLPFVWLTWWIVSNAFPQFPDQEKR